MIEIQANIKKEKEIINELLTLLEHKITTREEKLIVDGAITSLIVQLRILSNSVSGMLEQPVKKQLIKKYERVVTSTGIVFVNKREKQGFMNELGIEQESFRKLKEQILFTLTFIKDSLERV